MKSDNRIGCAWLASSMIRSDRLEQILDNVNNPGEALDIYLAGTHNGLFENLNPAETEALKKNSGSAALKRWELLFDKYRISVMTSKDSEYPPKLFHMSDPPHILFMLGNPECMNNRMLAMIGSRRATVKGLMASETIAKELSASGIGIVSGLAYGIDAASHKGCLSGKTPTVAVLGCGLDQNYPAENQKLKEDILHHGGLLLSEYAPGEKPLGWHFPVRNRIISGLSDAVILMEARIRSGSMTTVQHALDQGKEVFVYPGEPGSASSEGNHQLIREGGRYFTEANDILEDLGWLDNHNSALQNNDCCNLDDIGSPLQQKIIQALNGNQLGFDELCSMTGLSAPELSTNLTFLQLKGLVIALPGKQYASNR